MISESESTRSRLTQEQNKALQNEADTADVARLFGKECFNKAIDQIRFLNSELNIKSEGMDIMNHVVGG